MNFIFFIFSSGVSVRFTDSAFNLTENQAVPVCTEVSGDTLARSVTVTLLLSSSEGAIPPLCMPIGIVLDPTQQDNEESMFMPTIKSIHLYRRTVDKVTCMICT